LLLDNLFQLNHEPITVVFPAQEKEEDAWVDVDIEGEELGVGETFVHAIRDVSRWVFASISVNGMYD
jgi:hypothetical protein